MPTCAGPPLSLAAASPRLAPALLAAVLARTANRPRLAPVAGTREAEEGGESLSTIRPEKYAVIISDIVSDGLRVLSSAKAVTPAVPVVLKSNEHILTRSEAIQLGASELIEKSDLVFEQLNKIRSVLDGSVEI